MPKSDWFYKRATETGGGHKFMRYFFHDDFQRRKNEYFAQSVLFIQSQRTEPSPFGSIPIFFIGRTKEERKENAERKAPRNYEFLSDSRRWSMLSLDWLMGDCVECHIVSYLFATEKETSLFLYVLYPLCAGFRLVETCFSSEFDDMLKRNEWGNNVKSVQTREERGQCKLNQYTGQSRRFFCR